MRLGRWVLVLVAVLAVSAVVAVRMGEGVHWRTVRPVLVTDSAAAVSEPDSPGRTLYRRDCVMCHGERGAGTAIAPALADRARDQDAIARVIETGVPTAVPPWTPMPPRGDGTFSESEVREVAEYVQGLARK
jgi:mono/diheme cytochrome c family protein